MTNARDVIEQAFSEWTCMADDDLEDHILVALMEAAGVEPGGHLVIENVEGWPVGRLERAASGPKAHTYQKACDIPGSTCTPLYRVVAP